MASGIGFLLVVALALFGAALLYGVHRIARPTGALESRVSDALRELEPRGGRHRFSVRLFEVTVLSAVWVVGGGALVLWVPVAASLSPQGNAAAAFVGLTLAITTWWAWRRGALRPPRGISAVEHDRSGDLP